ncbi:DUF2326 domain-containing protein [Janthinobacterium aquaticum]|uniref:DUF2326 domain-containing protein n=1 Tax=Janthinobacterium sp. FT58W TaxID=2654254 RepID=UPI001264694D|nr:DUF2326 domain-containing protein [Janthinobacterium sp. FT58W]KAB8043334.1 DUF2326 domain-containing protein [Janthinobacterium sp. FT58W]
MRLVKLYANRETFNTVHFNETGLTLIIGAKTNQGSTYNGVGKSLIVELLHFCLGSKKNSEFEKKIPQWEFSLDFKIDGKTHVVSRNTSSQGVVHLDHKEIKLAELNDWFESRLFSIPSNISGLTYRSLLPKFLRRGLKQYVDPRDTGDFSEYEMLVRNAFLLGIDVELISKKMVVRSEITRLKQLRQNFKEDSLLKEFYSGGRDSDILLSHLDQQIQGLNKKRDDFVVAENFYDLQKNADALAVSIEQDKNLIFLWRSAVENISESMVEQPHISLDRVNALYGELLENFKSFALKRLDEVTDFHKRMLENRIARLSSEKLRLIDKISQAEIELRKKQKDLDDALRTLSQSQALDQYTVLVGEISDLMAQAQKVRDYKAIDIKYSNQAADLDGVLSEEVKKTNNYLEETKEYRERNFSVFKSFVSDFYPNSPAGITFHNNEGNNQKRFDFDVKVENDSSDGINEVRIFCYDLTLLALRKNHKVDFIFHDGRLFANMDVRQRAQVFTLADRVVGNLGAQYIATLNPDFISGMSDEFTSDEYQRLIVDNTVLELRDDSPSGKLLGIQVDMHYESK